MLVGIPLGLLVGVVSGVAFVLLIREALRGEVIRIAGLLTSMPGTWFGGGWLTELFDLDAILSSYVATLAVSFLLIAAYPLLRLVVRLGNEIGEAAGG
jgi:hypothetical protein